MLQRETICWESSVLKLLTTDLSSDNRSVVNNFRGQLSQQIVSLCNMVSMSISQQNEHLQRVQELGHSFLDMHYKVIDRLWLPFSFSYRFRYLLSQYFWFNWFDFIFPSFVLIHLIHAWYFVSVNWGIEEEIIGFEGHVYFSHRGSAKCCPFAQGQLYCRLRGNFFDGFFQHTVY